MRISDWSSDVCSSDLLDAQRDALALRVHRKHHGFQGVALLVVARDVLAGGVPADVGQVDQAVDAAVQADEDAEVGDRSEEHTSELQSLMRISYAVFCLKKKKKNEQL